MNSANFQVTHRGLLLATLLLIVSSANAAYVLTIAQVGASVVASGGGSLNLSGAACGTAGGGAGIQPSDAYFGVGPLGGNNPETACRLPNLTGPLNFGTGGFSAPSAGNGDLFEFIPKTSYVYPYRGYVSGNYLAGSATWDNATITGLGLAAGVYTWNWGAGTTADSLTVTVSVDHVVEFFNPDLDNFFITANAVEQVSVDSGVVGRWQKTGGAFRAGGPNAVCRFYGNALVNPATGAIYGPNSHFYTADANECAGLKALYAANARSWKFESNDFLTTPATNGTCPAGLMPVYRAYNNGFAKGVDSNHRITANGSAYLQTVAAGWIGEGIVMCAQP